MNAKFINRLAQSIGVVASVIFASIALSGCFTSDVAMVLPKDGITDNDIVGVWHGSIQNNDVYLHVIPNTAPWYRVIRVAHMHVGGSSEVDDYRFYPCALRGEKYLNIMVAKPSENVNQESSPQEKKIGYTFLKYQVSTDKTLTLWILSLDKVKEAVDKNQLAGKAWDTTWDRNVMVNDSDERVREYIIAHPDDFEVYGTFRPVMDVPVNEPAKSTLERLFRTGTRVTYR